MTEHRIRLRGGWGCCLAGSPESGEQRVTLPICWSGDVHERMRLTRRFGRPPFDRERQALVLELEQAAGIHSIVLNGRPIAGVSPERTDYEIEIDHSRERNVLVIEIDPPRTGTREGTGSAEWGKVAVVIRPIDPAAG